MSVAMQTRKPDKVVIYDDSRNPIDMRNNQTLLYIFQLFDQYGIQWEVQPGLQRGQHVGHQIIQNKAKDLIWRIDDDEVAEPNTLKNLLLHMKDGVGAVGGLVLMPGAEVKQVCWENPISDLTTNCQWYRWVGVHEVEHLYSSYLYRKGIQDYEINLSPVAHREETLHSYGIFRKGYKLIVDSSAITYHLRSNTGGIRTGNPVDWHNDELTFREIMREYDGKITCIVDAGKGDHLVFKSVLPKIKEKYREVTLAVCYPEIFPGEKCISIAEGSMTCNPERHNIFKWCIDHNHKTEMKYAYAGLYGVTI